MLNRVAIVTGGFQGIGKDIAAELLRNQMRVMIADVISRSDPRVSQLLSHLNEEIKKNQKTDSLRVSYCETDVSNEDQVCNLVSMTLQIFSTNEIHVLVNNAAITNPVNSRIEELDLAAWNRVLGVNLTGPFLLTKHVVPHMAKFSNNNNNNTEHSISSPNAIINIASTRALMSEKNGEAYAASKGGMLSLTHALANSLGPRVRVNCILPGWINTSSTASSFREEDHAQHPVGRIGVPNDVSQMVLFLADESKSGFITGQSFVVDGGMTKKMIYLED